MTICYTNVHVDIFVTYFMLVLFHLIRISYQNVSNAISFIIQKQKTTTTKQKPSSTANVLWEYKNIILVLHHQLKKVLDSFHKWGHFPCGSLVISCAGTLFVLQQIFPKRSVNLLGRSYLAIAQSKGGKEIRRTLSIMCNIDSYGNILCCSRPKQTLVISMFNNACLILKAGSILM